MPPRGQLLWGALLSADASRTAVGAPVTRERPSRSVPHPREGTPDPERPRAPIFRPAGRTGMGLALPPLWVEPLTGWETLAFVGGTSARLSVSAGRAPLPPNAVGDQANNAPPEGQHKLCPAVHQPVNEAHWNPRCQSSDALAAVSRQSPPPRGHDPALRVVAWLHHQSLAGHWPRLARAASHRAVAHSRLP